MDELTKQYYEIEIQKLQEEPAERRSIKCDMRLDEMAVHCDKRDNNGMEIVVGGTPWWEKSKNGSGSRKEHNPPHAHIKWETKGKVVCSRFQIVDSKIPETASDLKTVNDTDIPLDSIADTLIKWAKEKPRRYTESSNWEAMRGSWMQIQDYVNEGLKHPVILQSKDDFDKASKEAEESEK